MDFVLGLGANVNPLGLAPQSSLPVLCSWLYPKDTLPAAGKPTPRGIQLVKRGGLGLISVCDLP